MGNGSEGEEVVDEYYYIVVGWFIKQLLWKCCWSMKFVVVLLDDVLNITSIIKIK